MAQSSTQSRRQAQRPSRDIWESWLSTDLPIDVGVALIISGLIMLAWSAVTLL